MRLTSAKCPNCGADIKVNKEEEKTVCEYCKSEILVEDAIAKLKVVVEGEVELKGVPKLESYLKLSDRAYKDGEFDEAYANYSKALELDSDNATAILRQGLSKVLKEKEPLKMTFSSGLSAYQNAIKIDESLKESGATDLAVALASEEEVLTEFYRTHILTKSELDKYMKELLSLLEGNITIIANSEINKKVCTENALFLIGYISEKKEYGTSERRFTYKLSKEELKYLEDTKKVLKEGLKAQNKAEVKETLEKTKEEPRKPQTKKDKIINGILLVITIIMIIYTLSYGKSTIWFWMYIIEFLILIVTLSSKDVMPATNRVKNILLVLAVIGTFGNSYPAFAISSYKSVDEDLVIKFNKKEVIVNGKKTTYKYKDNDGVYYIEIDDVKLKYDYHKGKYLLCVTKDGKCISYLVPTDEKGDNYIQNIDDENKYFNK